MPVLIRAAHPGGHLPAQKKEALIMCRTGGRRCPSSRSAPDGGTRGQPRPAAGQAGDTPPEPTVINYAAPTATVGGQYGDVRIGGGITLGPSGVVISGPVTGTPSAEPTARQAAAAEAAAARALAAAGDALRAASHAAAEGGAVNVAGDGDVIAFQVGGITYRR